MDEYVETILKVAERDASIAQVLREICTLDDAVRATALDLVGAHLASRAAAAETLDVVRALRRQDVARHIAERLPPGGSAPPAG